MALITPNWPISKAIKNRQPVWRFNNFASSATSGLVWPAEGYIELDSVPYAIAIGEFSTFDQYTVFHDDPMYASGALGARIVTRDRPLVLTPNVRIGNTYQAEDYAGRLRIQPTNLYSANERTAAPQSDGVWNVGAPTFGFASVFDIECYLGSMPSLVSPSRIPYSAEADTSAQFTSDYQVLLNLPIFGRKRVNLSVWRATGSVSCDVRVQLVKYEADTVNSNYYQTILQQTITTGRVVVELESPGLDYVNVLCRPSDVTGPVRFGYYYNCFDT